MEVIRAKVNGAGRVVIPAELRKEYHIEDGEEVLFSRTEFGIQITPIDLAVRRAQEAAGRYAAEGDDPLAELRRMRGEDGTFA